MEAHYTLILILWLWGHWMEPAVTTCRPGLSFWHRLSDWLGEQDPSRDWQSMASWGMVEAGGQIKATNETKISRLGACHIFFRQLLKTAGVKVATVVLPLPQAAATGTTWVWWPSEENGTVEKGKKLQKQPNGNPHSPASKGPLVKRKWLAQADSIEPKMACRNIRLVLRPMMSYIWRLPKMGGIPMWMVFIMENPIKNCWFRGPPF